MDMSNHNTNPSWLAYFHHQPWRNMPQRILSIACSYYDFFSFNAVVTSLKINPLFKSKVISMRFALLMMSYTSGVCREIYRNRVNYYSVLCFSRTYWPATTLKWNLKLYRVGFAFTNGVGRCLFSVYKTWAHLTKAAVTQYKTLPTSTSLKPKIT